MDNALNNPGESNLNEILESFVTSYAQRDKNADFANWLSEKIIEENSDMSAADGAKLSNDIIESVSRYDKTLAELNNAVDNGQAKEDWLADRLIENCSDMPLDDAGTSLQRIEDAWSKSNSQLMGEVIDVPEEALEYVDAESGSWNKYSLKSKALDIGKFAIASGMGTAADIVKGNLEDGEPVDVADAIGKALQEGVETAKSEVKAVVAGAVKVAAEKGLTKLLPKDTSVDTICDFAGVAVESVDALVDLATGKSTITATLDRIGKATVAAACRLGAGVLEAKVAVVSASIPVLGPVIVKISGNLIAHMKTPKFADNVYAVVRDVAVATWEGIKEVGRNVISNFASQKIANTENS